MKSLQLIVLLGLIACSSTKVKDGDLPENVTNESFKKETPLKKNEVSDFYSQGANSLSPALQDETLDRYSIEELNKLSDSEDPLWEIALRCSKKDFNNAFIAASKAFNKYQKIPAYWNQVANCHLNQGSERKALLFYNKALEVSPDYVPALNNIGVLYSRQGQSQKALVAFEKAHSKSKFAKTPRYNLAKTYLSYGLAEKSLPLFQGLLNSSPEDIDLLNATANSYFLMSDYQKAMGLFQKIPQVHWKNAEIGLNVAVTLKKLGRDEDARKVFKMINTPEESSLKEYYSSVANHLGEKL